MLLLEDFVVSASNPEGCLGACFPNKKVSLHGDNRFVMEKESQDNLVESINLDQNVFNFFYQIVSFHLCI